MIQSSKRHMTRTRTNLAINQLSLTNKKRSCPIKLSTTTIGTILLTLVVFSLYLSTQILPSDPQYITNNPNPSHTTSTLKKPPLFQQSSNAQLQNPNIIAPNSNKKHNQKIHTSTEIEKALQKSLNMYLNRPGHNDRVEYLIGFRGERITSPSQYQTLQIRNTKKYERDYRTSPITISGWNEQPITEPKCDALCIRCSSFCDISGIKWSMENVAIAESENHITGTTKLDSLIPVPYFSWHDFQFMLPMQPKTAEGLAAAFISNCGFRKRNNMVRELQKYGVKVDSYGRCEHNTDEVRNVDGKRGSKIEILQSYKFSLAFENSETDDYITEKFFGTLQSGSVPVYIGGSNVKFFAPDFGEYGNGAGKPWQSKAVIWAGDFDFDAQKLAKYLLYLDSNDTAYNEYLRYKTEGYSGDFKAMVELTAGTHTNCRQCILATDWVRYRNGVGTYDEVINQNVFAAAAGSEVIDAKWFYVRERGMYRFTLLRLEENTLESFVRSVLISVKPKSVNLWINNEHPHYDRIGPALYAIYHLPNKNVIHSDVAIQNIPQYAEVEVIFV